jgi:hypothetical protein
MGIIHNKNIYISRKSNNIIESWSIYFINEKISYCSNNCRICGNYKNSSFNSKKSQTEIEKYVYSKLNIEFQNKIFYNALFDYKLYYIYNNLINLKIKCNCFNDDNYDDDDDDDDGSDYEWRIGYWM